MIHTALLEFRCTISFIYLNLEQEASQSIGLHLDKIQIYPLLK